MLQILEAYGYRREADEVVRRVTRMVCRAPYIYEWYDSRTGDGSRSVAEYSWSASLLLAMLHGRHREPVVS